MKSAPLTTMQVQKGFQQLQITSTCDLLLPGSSPPPPADVYRTIAIAVTSRHTELERERESEREERERERGPGVLGDCALAYF